MHGQKSKKWVVIAQYRTYRKGKKSADTERMGVFQGGGLPIPGMSYCGFLINRVDMWTMTVSHYYTTKEIRDRNDVRGTMFMSDVAAQPQHYGPKGWTLDQLHMQKTEAKMNTLLKPALGKPPEKATTKKK